MKRTAQGLKKSPFMPTLAISMLVGAGIITLANNAKADDISASQQASAPVPGFGSNVKLSDVTRMVAPGNMRAVYTNGASPDDIVSWKGGRPWKDILETVAATHDMSLTVSGNTIIYASKNEKKTTPETTAKPPATLADTSSSKKTATRNSSHHRITKHKTQYARAGRVPSGGSRFDSPTIDQVGPAQAYAMTQPMAGSRLMPATGREGFEAGKDPMGHGNLSGQNAVPAFGEMQSPISPDYAQHHHSGHLWTAHAGESFFEVVRRWAKESGEGWDVTVDHDTQTIDMTLITNQSYNGTFIEAVRSLTSDYHAEINPIVNVWHDGNGNRNVININDTEHATLSVE